MGDGRGVGGQPLFFGGDLIAIGIVTVAECDLGRSVRRIGVAEGLLATGIVIAGGAGDSVRVGLAGEATLLIPTLGERV